jgi:hypothetical protein
MVTMAVWMVSDELITARADGPERSGKGKGN